MNAPNDLRPDSTGQTAAALEVRLEDVLETIGEAFYALDREWRFTIFNRAAASYFGVPRDQVIGRTMWEVFPQGAGTAFEDVLRRAMDGRIPASFETFSVLRPGRTLEMKITPMGDGGVAASFTDITERKLAEDALRAERDRNAEILESISDAFYAVDQDWRFTYVNRIAEAWWARTREEMIGKVLWEEFPQTVDSPSWHALHQAARDRQVTRWEAQSQLTGQWIDVSAFPTATGLSVYFRDISDRKQAERRQQLLVNELNHRVKNSLAVVQAIAQQTLSGARSLPDAREAFTARLIALAGAHDVITRENWAGADLAEVIERSVKAQMDRPDRLAVDGPPVTVSPKLALSLALAFHELTTNAMKYGALSAPAGRIVLSWTVSREGGARRLALRWAETGGPPVAPPSHRGFGSRLVERALAADIGGAVALHYRPEGVVCEIAADLEPHETFDPAI